MPMAPPRTNRRTSIMGYAMSQDTSVRYIDKSREYYAAHGYDRPYKWAHYDDIPFTPLPKSLADCKVTIITTAMPDANYVNEHRRLAVGDLHAPPAEFFTGELAWDEEATHTRDRESYFPLLELERRITAGELGELAPHHYCIPTLYSARHNIEHDIPAIVKSCIEDDVDVALLVPL